MSRERVELGVLKSAIHEWAIEDLETLSNDELGDQLVELNTVIDQLELQRARRLDHFNRRTASLTTAIPPPLHSWSTAA